jgi:hypothetical protein
MLQKVRQLRIEDRLSLTQIQQQLSCSKTTASKYVRLVEEEISVTERQKLRERYNPTDGLTRKQRYYRTIKGKAQMARQDKKKDITPEGRAKHYARNARYHKTLHGRAKRQTAENSRRSTPAAKAVRTQKTNRALSSRSGIQTSSTLTYTA